MIETVIRQAAALLLDYPGPDWPDTAEIVRDALTAVRDPRCEPLLGFLADAAAIPPLELQARYVATFDRSRRRTLHLTYYTDGDTRRRGASLAALKALYRDHGWCPPEDQLPDHLPVMLEFAARCPGPGVRLLREHRAGIDLLRAAVRDRGSPYATVLDAVAGTLPPSSPRDERTARELARTGPPAEAVGLEPYGGPR